MAEAFENLGRRRLVRHEGCRIDGGMPSLKRKFFSAVASEGGALRPQRNYNDAG